VALSETGGEGFTEVGGQRTERGQSFGRGGLEDALHFGGEFGALLVAVHAERAGQLVGDIEGFDAGGFGESAGGSSEAELVHQIETLPNGREIFLPELEENVVYLIVDLGADRVRGGFLHRLRQCGLVLPAEDFGDLLGESEGIEGFEEDAGEAQSGEAAFIDTLDFGGE
jgi:hypothetical protein